MMATSQLVERLAVLAALVGLVVGVAAHAPVAGGVVFWGSLAAGWLIGRWARDREG